MTKLYNVIYINHLKQESNIIVRAEHLDEYLWKKGFAVRSHYYIGELFEPTEETRNEFYKEYKLYNEFDLSKAYAETLKVIKIK